MKKNKISISLDSLMNFISLIIFTILSILIAISNQDNLWILIISIFGAGVSTVAIALVLIGLGYKIKTKSPISISISIEEDIDGDKKIEM